MMTEKQNRRSFIRNGAIAISSAVSLPFFVPRHVLGMADECGANEQIVVGIIGMGIRGTQLASNISAPGRIAAICDVDSRKTTAAFRKFNANWDVYEDYRKLLERKDLDGVLICTQHHQHVLPGILACQAGMDVYVEKPLSLYVSEGRELVKAARKYRRVVQVGSQQRTMEMDRFACEFVRDGGIGKVQKIEAVNFPGPIPYPAGGLPEEPVPEWFNWDLWQGQAPVHPFNHQLAFKESRPFNCFCWRDYSGGGTDMFAHALDMVQYALGKDDSGPVEFWPVEGEAERARVDFRYADGLEVHLKFPAYKRGPQLGAVFVGEHCKMEINRNKFVTNPPDFIQNPPDAELAKKWEGDGWVAKGHIENWFDCIKTRNKPNADVEIGHRTVTIGHLINITREVRRRLRWDPETEQIIDDAEANALLDRPRRKGWELPSV